MSNVPFANDTSVRPRGSLIVYEQAKLDLLTGFSQVLTTINQPLPMTYGSRGIPECVTPDNNGSILWLFKIVQIIIFISLFMLSWVNNYYLTNFACTLTRNRKERSCKYTCYVSHQNSCSVFFQMPKCQVAWGHPMLSPGHVGATPYSLHFKHGARSHSQVGIFSTTLDGS